MRPQTDDESHMASTFHWQSLCSGLTIMNALPRAPKDGVTASFTALCVQQQQQQQHPLSDLHA